MSLEYAAEPGAAGPVGDAEISCVDQLGTVAARAPNRRRGPRRGVQEDRGARHRSRETGLERDKVDVRQPAMLEGPLHSVVVERGRRAEPGVLLAAAPRPELD